MNQKFHGKVELWKPDTGEIEAVNFENYDISRTSVHLRLQADEAYFLVVRKD
jgi:hypothetical protein